MQVPGRAATLLLLSMLWMTGISFHFSFSDNLSTKRQNRRSMGTDPVGALDSQCLNALKACYVKVSASSLHLDSAAASLLYHWHVILVILMDQGLINFSGGLRLAFFWS